MSTDFDAVIIGAGFGGMYMLHRLRQKGFTARVFEAGKGVGGTWYWNRYPGARCDVESVQYSYQFSSELEQEWEWTERYATQPEILRYANHVADRFDLRRDIRFETRIKAAVFDETANLWRVETDRGDKVAARFVITAMGCLSSPNTPKIAGLADFKGPTYHTGNWPHEGVDFTGKTVGVIGTGSSAIQSIPIMAQQARHLTVFQRTANYTVPAHNKPLDPAYVAEVKAHYPEMRKRAKSKPAGIDFVINMASAIETPVRGALGLRRAGLHGVVLRSVAERRVEQDRGRFRTRQDPRSGEGPEDGRNPDAEEYHRLQAVVCRHRLLGNLQPSQRLAGRHQRRADRAHHRQWPARQRPRLQLRLPGAGDRLRRHDRRAAEDRYPRSRRCRTTGQVARRAEVLSRPHGRGLSQPLHHHRAGQPVGVVQSAAANRATRQLDHRLYRLYARQRHVTD